MATINRHPAAGSTSSLPQSIRLAPLNSPAPAGNRRAVTRYTGVTNPSPAATVRPVITPGIVNPPPAVTHRRICAPPARTVTPPARTVAPPAIQAAPTDQELADDAADPSVKTWQPPTDPRHLSDAIESLQSAIRIKEAIRDKSHNNSKPARNRVRRTKREAILLRQRLEQCQRVQRTAATSANRPGFASGSGYGAGGYRS